MLFLLSEILHSPNSFSLISITHEAERVTMTEVREKTREWMLIFCQVKIHATLHFTTTECWINTHWIILEEGSCSDWWVVSYCSLLSFVTVVCLLTMNTE